MYSDIFLFQCYYTIFARVFAYCVLVHIFTFFVLILHLYFSVNFLLTITKKVFLKKIYQCPVKLNFYYCVNFILHIKLFKLYLSINFYSSKIFSNFFCSRNSESYLFIFCILIKFVNFVYL